MLFGVLFGALLCFLGLVFCVFLCFYLIFNQSSGVIVWHVWQFVRVILEPCVDDFCGMFMLLIIVYAYRLPQRLNFKLFWVGFPTKND